MKKWFNPKIAIPLLSLVAAALLLEVSLKPGDITQLENADSIEAVMALQPRLPEPGQFNLALYQTHWQQSSQLLAHDSQSVWVYVPGVFGKWAYQRTDFVENSAPDFQQSQYRLNLTTPLILIGLLAYFLLSLRK